MAFFEANFFSEALGMCVTANVILPQQTTRQIGLEGVEREADKHPCLYLLHGLSDDHSIWLRRTSIERYAAAYGLAVVMPNVHRSFYTDMHTGLKYFTYVAEELPQLMESFFPISKQRDDRFIAGLSMGGYGAWKVALNKPDQYAAAASLSGVVDMAERVRSDLRDEHDWIFGDVTTVPGSQHDCMHLIEQHLKDGVDLPQLYQICGTEDFLYDNNVGAHQRLKDLAIPYVYKEAPGVHNWDFWDEHIQDVLSWLPLK